MVVRCKQGHGASSVSAEGAQLIRRCDNWEIADELNAFVNKKEKRDSDFPSPFFFPSTSTLNVWNRRKDDHLQGRSMLGSRGRTQNRGS